MERILWETALVGAVILAAAGVVAETLRGRSAAARHLVWAIGLACVAALPLLEAGLPGWRLPLLPAAPEAAGSGPVAAGSAAGLLFTLWLIGAAAVVGTTMVGRSRVSWLARTSVPLDGGAWPALASSLGDRLRLPRRVAIRRSDRVTTPMMWGILRPVILLPAEADGWPERMRRDVLLHELVHVKRNDYAIQVLARLACAIHWFNPLVWAAARRLRIERERACDDHVLQAGADPCDYAASLLAMARALGRSKRPTAAVAMADRTRFGERLAALLDPRRPRGVLARRTVMPAALTAALVVSLVAAVQPTRRATTSAPGAAMTASAPAAALTDWARAAETTHGPTSDPAASRAARSASAAPASRVAVYQAPAVRIVLSGDGDRVEMVPAASVGGDGRDIHVKDSEACDPGESHDSTPRTEPAVRPVQVAARPAEVTAH
ncbi:MAG TPA: M56 family metallopeptidase [Gemmatimonadota bacterium]|nr:M56 family metallopeptidase [Gemmatimonadota bacterium]